MNDLVKKNPFVPTTFQEAVRLAEIMAKSDLVPKDYRGKPGNCLIAMQMGAEVGLAPMQAIQNIAVINGRPAVWGDAMLALVKGSGLLEWIEESAEDGVATCTVKRKGEKPVTRRFSIEDAKTAGLIGKPGPWQQYPNRMLQMRARAFALRDTFPDVLRGLNMAEEVMDIPQEKEVPTTVERVIEKIEHKAPEEEIDIDSIIMEIAAAKTAEDLRAAAAKARNLKSEEDKQRARECYKDALAMLKEEQEDQ